MGRIILSLCEKPLFLVTTSHRPTQRVRSFVKDIVSILPCAAKLTRGKATLRDIFFEARSVSAKRVVIISTWKGNPGSLYIYEPGETIEEGLRLIAMFRLSGVKLSRERPEAQRSYGVKSLGVLSLSNVEEHKLLSDIIVRAFLAKLVFDTDTPIVDVVAVIRPPSSASHFAEIDFLCTASRRPCGPLLRVVRVEDYVSGHRLHRSRRI
jgi:U3 small nucleolar ribonucleoprotein protein IMP4